NFVPHPGSEPGTCRPSPHSARHTNVFLRCALARHRSELTSHVRCGTSGHGTSSYGRSVALAGDPLRWRPTESGRVVARLARDWRKLRLATGARQVRVEHPGGLVLVAGHQV